MNTIIVILLASVISVLVQVYFKLKATNKELVKRGQKISEYKYEARYWEMRANDYGVENKNLRKSLEEISSKKYFEMGRYPAPYIAPVPPWSIAERALAK